MYDNEYIDEIFLEDISQVSTRNPYKWLLAPLLLAFLPWVIFLSVPRNLIHICLLAYLNCLVIGFAVWWFAKKRTLAAMVPVVFMPYLFVAGPIPILFFAILHPNEAYYPTFHGDVSVFDAGVRFQLCILLFLIGYFSTMILFLKNERQTESMSPIRSTSLGYILGTFIITVIFFDGLIRIKGLVGGPIKYLIDGLHSYYHGLIFIVGSFLKRFWFVFRIAVFIFLGFAVLFYSVANYRGVAIRAITYFVLGIFLFSRYSPRTKVILAICLCLSLPVYLTVAEATRTAIGTVGFAEGFFYRLKTLMDWQYIRAGHHAVSHSLGRIFFKGGHSIIAYTPEQYPYRLFMPHIFVREILESLLPGVLIYRTYYRGTLMLLDYGFNIIPGVTSVEVSIIGNLWWMGGWLPVFFGAAALGLTHGILARILQRSWRVSEMKAIVYFSTLAPGILWGPNFDFITHWRYMVWRLMAAIVIYRILRIFIAEQTPQDLSTEQE